MTQESTKMRKIKTPLSNLQSRANPNRTKRLRRIPRRIKFLRENMIPNATFQKPRLTKNLLKGLINYPSRKRINSKKKPRSQSLNTSLKFQDQYLIRV